MRRYTWVIPTPAGRRGVEVWLGPVGLALTWPPGKPAWSWGWWRYTPVDYVPPCPHTSQRLLDGDWWACNLCGEHSHGVSLTATLRAGGYEGSD